jgi:diguanylate cyclase (GGDEF)-like protein/PAS domain S-box-containing protein
MLNMPDQNDFYRELLDYLSDGIYFTDKERRIAYWNKGAEVLAGYSSHEVMGKCCKDNLLMHVDTSGRELCLHGCPLDATIQDGQPREAEVFLHHKSGHRVPIRVRIAAMRNDEGAIVGAVETFSDNNAHLQMTEKLSQMEKMALLDSLTGLANRRYLESIIRSRMEELHRNKWSFGVLFADIDNFKRINDAYGHDIGDRVLQMVGLTLNSASRYSDMIGRWGGEEFIAVIVNADALKLREIGERLRILVERSSLVDPERIGVTVSIGGAQALQDDTMESLLRRADEKLYEAKKSGKNRLCI